MFLARNFNVKQDEVGNTDGTILFIFPDWYFGALIFSVVNAAAKRRSKFAFQSLTIIVYRRMKNCCCCWMKIRQKMLSSTKKSTKDLTSMTFIIDIELIRLSATPVFLKQK